MEENKFTSGILSTLCMSVRLSEIEILGCVGLHGTSPFPPCLKTNLRSNSMLSKITGSSSPIDLNQFNYKTICANKFKCLL